MNVNIPRLARAGSVLALLVGCTAGRDFVRPKEDALVFGKTSREEILQDWGKPFLEATQTKNGRILQIATYSYASSYGSAHASGVTPARSMDFIFDENRLVGYSFRSSYADDHSDFDESKVPELKKDETTRAQVLALLGTPAGRAVFPVAKEKGHEAVCYEYVQYRLERGVFKNTPHLYHKRLIVSLSPEGIVSDIDLVISGEK